MFNRDFEIKFLRIVASTVIPDVQKFQIYELCRRYTIEYPSSEFISAYEYLVENNYIKGTIGSGFSIPFVITKKGVGLLESLDQR